MFKKLAATALTAVLVVGVSSQAFAAPVTPQSGDEKCFGVAKKGKNDCGSAKHACAGQAAKSGDHSDFVFLPKGSCDKLVNGSTTEGKK